MALTNHREAGEFGEGATMRSEEGLRDDPMYLAFLRRIGDGRKDWTAEQDDADVVALLVSDGYAVRHDVYAHSILITKAGANYLALIDRIEALEKALRPFVEQITIRDGHDDGYPDEAPLIAYSTGFREPGHTVTYGDFRLARTTLSGDTK